MPTGKRAFLQGVAFWGVVLGLCYLGLRYALPCFLPLVLGAVMAAALHPAAAGLCRRLGWRYRPCAVLVAVAALTLLGLILWGIGGVVVRQGSALLPQIPAFYRETLLPLAEELREKWQTLQQGRAGGGWGTSLEEVLQNAVTTLSRRVVGWLGGIASSLPSILFTMTFTVLSTIFFLQDYAGITGFIVRSLPGRWLRLDYTPTELTVLTDEKWLCFVLEQLLSNALKYTREGSITVELAGERVLAIRDTGIGIAPEDLPRIFEKGYTGQNGRADKRASGLGLYLCSRICRNLGVGLTVKSTSGVGTTLLLDFTQYPLRVE